MWADRQFGSKQFEVGPEDALYLFTWSNGLWYLIFWAWDSNRYPFHWIRPWLCWCLVLEIRYAVPDKSAAILFEIVPELGTFYLQLVNSRWNCSDSRLHCVTSPTHCSICDVLRAWRWVSILAVGVLQRPHWQGSWHFIAQRRNGVCDFEEVFNGFLTGDW